MIKSHNESLKENIDDLIDITSNGIKFDDVKALFGKVWIHDEVQYKKIYTNN